MQRQLKQHAPNGSGAISRLDHTPNTQGRGREGSTCTGAQHRQTSPWLTSGPLTTPPAGLPVTMAHSTARPPRLCGRALLSRAPACHRAQWPHVISWVLCLVCSRPPKPHGYLSPVCSPRATCQSFSVFCCFSGNVPQYSRSRKDRKKAKREQAAFQKVRREFFHLLVVQCFRGEGAGSQSDKVLCRAR